MINLKDCINGTEPVHTGAFQRAIDMGSEHGGESIFVPFGEYTLGTVVLKDNTNIVFEDGVRIRSVGSLDDFADDEEVDHPLYQDLSHSKYTKAMFYADNVKGIKISGKATIDMLSVWDNENKRARDGYFRGAKVFSMRKVEDLEIYGVRIINATDIAILMGGCKNVCISKVNINSYIDGISPDGCENVNISDCNIKTGDDALVIKTSYFDNCIRHCKNINITNCILSCRANAIKLGTESIGDFKYINISNCTIYNTNHSGIAIESADGANISAVNISNITMSNVTNPIFIYLSDRLRAPSGTVMGSISNINISNVYADISTEKYQCNNSWSPADLSVENDPKILNDYAVNISAPSIIMSTDENNKLKNISLSNVALTVLGGETNVSEILPSSKAYPESTTFTLPAYGLYARNVVDLHLENVRITALSPDAREAIIIKE